MNIAINKQLVTAKAFLICLLFLAFHTQAARAQSQNVDSRVKGAYGVKVYFATSSADSTGGYNNNSSGDNGEGEEPPPEDGYDRKSEGLPGMLSAGSLAERPAKVALLGNYPNPFNRETTIRFAIQDGQHVRVAVFNLMGQRVQLLVDGYMEAGQHEARFVAQDLPSGTYFARLETRAGVALQKMVLAK